jgi:RHS repeat-associated protein
LCSAGRYADLRGERRGGKADLRAQLACVLRSSRRALRKWSEDLDGGGSVTQADRDIGDACAAGAIMGDAGYNVLMDLDFSGVIEQDEYDRCQSMTGIGALDPGAISDPDFDAGPWNPVGFDGYVYDDVADMSCVRFRWYQAGLGRWITRDPADYVDGASAYQFAGGQPQSATDPLGLWTWKGGKRQGQARATMVAQEGDTTETAAKFTGLSATDTNKWLQHLPDNVMVAPGDEIIPCDEYSVPNTIYATVGDLSSRKNDEKWWGKLRSSPILNAITAESARAVLRSWALEVEGLGYKVLWAKHGSIQTIRWLVAQPDTAGWGHTSHGDKGRIYAYNPDDDDEVFVTPNQVQPRLHHKLSHVVLFSCQAGQLSWQNLVSENGVYRARCGSFNPNWEGWEDLKRVPVDEGCQCPPVEEESE